MNQSDKAKPEDKKILIVEDDRSLIGFLQICLSHEGFNVLIATDGKTAYQLIKENMPDLVLLDMMLPEKTGFELIKLMQSPEYRHIPIIAISGRFVDANFRTLVLSEPNVKEYIIKPIKEPHLLYVIHSILNTSPSVKVQDEKKKMFSKEDFDPEKFER